MRQPSRIAVAGALALASLLASAIAASAQQQDERPVPTRSFSEVPEQLGPVVPSECLAGRDCPAISGVVRFEMRAYAESAGADFGTTGVAFIHRYAGSWTIEAATLPGAQVPLWDSERFATEVTFEKQAVDPRSRKSGVEASVKNPEPTEPLVAFAGLRPRGEPTFGGPPATAAAPAVCPSGPGPDAGTLELSRPHYVTDETVGTPFVLVTRTGGSTGVVSASVITSDGSAAAGADYRAVSTTVRFENGDTSPRLVQIPIFRDAVPENAETFDVSLLDPNCVVFGAQTTAGVTIADVPEGDRRLRPPETRPAPQSIPFASRVRCLVALRACRRRTALGPGLLAAGPASD